MAKNPSSNAPSDWADTLYGMPVVVEPDINARFAIKAQVKDAGNKVVDVAAAEAAEKAKDSKSYVGPVDIDRMTFQDWQVYAQNPELFTGRDAIFKSSPFGKGPKDIIWLTQKVNLATYDGVLKPFLNVV